MKTKELPIPRTKIIHKPQIRFYARCPLCAKEGKRVEITGLHETAYYNNIEKHMKFKHKEKKQ